MKELNYLLLKTFAGRNRAMGRFLAQVGCTVCALLNIASAILFIDFSQGHGVWLGFANAKF